MTSPPLGDLGEHTHFDYAIEGKDKCPAVNSP